MISPKIDTYISIVIALVAGIGAGALPAFPGIAPDAWVLVQKWCMTLVTYSAILSPLFPAFSSAKAGPLVKSDAPK